MGNTSGSERCRELLSEHAEGGRLLVLAAIWSEGNANDKVSNGFITEHVPQRFAKTTLTRTTIQRAHWKR